MQIISIRDNLHEISKPVMRANNKKKKLFLYVVYEDFTQSTNR